MVYLVLSRKLSFSRFVHWKNRGSPFIRAHMIIHYIRKNIFMPFITFVSWSLYFLASSLLRLNFGAGNLISQLNKLQCFTQIHKSTMLLS
jgi:hypothetical protein